MRQCVEKLHKKECFGPECIKRVGDKSFQYFNDAAADEEMSYDILLAVADPESYPLHLGEKMSRGEHVLFHAGENGRLEDYNKKFSIAYLSMIGALGLSLVVSDKNCFRGNRKEARYKRTFKKCRHGVADYIGYSTGRQLAKRSDVPFRDLFQIPHQIAGWKLVCDIIEPVIKMDAGYYRGVLKMLPHVFKEIDFEPNIVSRIGRKRPAGK